jgi:hypothetical protein
MLNVPLFFLVSKLLYLPDVNTHDRKAFFFSSMFVLVVLCAEGGTEKGRKFVRKCGVVEDFPTRKKSTDYGKLSS